MRMTSLRSNFARIENLKVTVSVSVKTCLLERPKHQYVLLICYPYCRFSMAQRHEVITVIALRPYTRQKHAREVLSILAKAALITTRTQGH